MTITFKGCEFSGLKCTTQGAGSGEIVTSELSATLLYTNAEKKKVGLELAPAPGELFTSFDCVTTEVKVRGSVTGAITPTNKKVKPKGHFTLAVKKSKLEMAFRSAGYEHAALTFTDELSFAETTEIKA